MLGSVCLLSPIFLIIYASNFLISTRWEISTSQHLNHSANQHHRSCPDGWYQGCKMGKMHVYPPVCVPEWTIEEQDDPKTLQPYMGSVMGLKVAEEGGIREEASEKASGSSKSQAVRRGMLASPPSCVTLGNTCCLSLLIRNTGWASLVFKSKIWKLFRYWHDATVENSTPDFIWWIAITTVTQNNISLDSLQTICFNLFSRFQGSFHRSSLSEVMDL